MPDYPTREDLFQAGRDEIIARSLERPAGSRISPEAITTPGTDINVILAACSAMGDSVVGHLALRIAALYLDSAEGEDLDRLVEDRFAPVIVRRQATPALVTLKVTRSLTSGAGPVGTLDVGTVLATSDGVEYELLQPAGFSSTAVGPVYVLAQAVLAGSAGNAAAATITQFSATPFDPLLVCTNVEPASGGADTESDDSLRSRARDYYLTVQRATLTAIETGALTVAGVASATAYEEYEADGYTPTGVVRLLIADANGQANTTLTVAVRDAIREWRAAGVIPDVIGTTPVYPDIAYSLTFSPGTDEETAIATLKSLTVSVLSVLAPGEPLMRSSLYALARAIPGAIVADNAVTTPTTDLTPALGEIYRARLDTVSVNGS